MNPLIKTLLVAVAALPSANAITIILGDTTGNSRGPEATDIQTVHSAASMVASGEYSVAIGRNNTASGLFSVTLGSSNVASGSLSTGIGVNNQATGEHSLSVGLANNTAGYEALAYGLYNVSSGEWAYTSGIYNTVSGNYGIAIGFWNEVGDDSIAIGGGNISTGTGYTFGGSNTISSTTIDAGVPSVAIGYNNTITTTGSDAFAFGKSNVLSAGGTTVFGANITNSIANSTMIGPSNAAKVTILSSGNVGIGTAAPTSKLHVAGDATITGALSVSGAFTPSGAVNLANGQTLTLPSTGRIRVNTGSSLGGVHVVPTGTIDTGDFTKAAFSTSDGVGTLGIDPNQIINSGQELSIQSATDELRFNAASATTGDDLVIKTDGKVGIGTSAPSNALHVAAGTNAAGQIRVGITGQSGKIVFARGTDGKVYSSIGYAGTTEAANLSLVSGGSGSYITFFAQQAERMRVAQDGNVGIGTTTPAAKLDVSGTLQVAGNVTIKNVGATKSVIRISPAGDIDMGGFTSGTNPN